MSLENILRQHIMEENHGFVSSSSKDMYGTVDAICRRYLSNRIVQQVTDGTNTGGGDQTDLDH